jgi:YgiT-type zinc finger domain-containing protein
METPLTRCFHCGGTDLGAREVEELVSVDADVVRLRVPATVCRRCGERYFDPDTVRRFEEVRSRVRGGDLSGFRKVGEVLEPVAGATDDVERSYPLRGAPIRYDDPTEPVAENDWEALS